MERSGSGGEAAHSPLPGVTGGAGPLPARWPVRRLSVDADVLSALSILGTVRFWQEIYDDTGKLVEIHEKYPADQGHRKV